MIGNYCTVGARQREVATALVDAIEDFWSVCSTLTRDWEDEHLERVYGMATAIAEGRNWNPDVD